MRFEEISVAAERTRAWRTEMAALIERLKAHAMDGKNCTLSPYTAVMAAQGLTVWTASPTREEVGQAVCKLKPTCIRLCEDCLMKANKIMHLYTEAKKEAEPAA